MTFVCILVAWMFTLCLHEFAHALVAYKGGDATVRDKGYLTLNPLAYTNPVMSILFPLIILAIGGIALPGGAVYIEKDRLRGRGWETGVSLAGPGTNLACAFLLALPFHIGLAGETVFWDGYAFFVYIQILAAVLNLIPIPPLDGYGALEPWLGWRMRLKLQPLKNYGMLILFVLVFWVPPFQILFQRVCFFLTNTVLGVPVLSIVRGAQNFRILHF